jgi:nudix-type nucleoside diphosphatase (YffH/AdpP family)
MTISDRIKIQSSETLSENWGVLKETTFLYRRNDGSWQEQTRETYDRGNGVAVLLYDSARRTVILVKQFRLPAFVNGYDDLLIEVPAGKLDHTDPEAQMRAEIEEETGYRVRDLTRVFEAYMSPGAVTETLFFFVARYAPSDRVSQGGGHAHEGEDIAVLETGFDDALAMIASGAIRDAKTIMLLQYAALNLFRRDGRTD